MGAGNAGYGLGILTAVTMLGCGRISFEPAGQGVDSALDGSPDGTPTASCRALPPSCGPDGSAPCCTSLAVPGGTFYRSYDVAVDNQFNLMNSPATLSDYKLDAYEVTVGRFRQFVEDGAGTQSSPPAAAAGARALNGQPAQGGWDPAWNSNLSSATAMLVQAVKCNDPAASWTDTIGANESLPMNCLTWFEAFAFCVWDGGFLPTSAEWNYAAAGGSEQRAYPWSNPPADITIDCTHANHNAAVACGPFGVQPVGSRSPLGDGRWGHADLGGNVGEFQLDWVVNFDNPCTDCADLASGVSRGVRGGAYSDNPLFIRSALRDYLSPPERSPEAGVRCARAAQ